MTEVSGTCESLSDIQEAAVHEFMAHVIAAYQQSDVDAIEKLRFFNPSEAGRKSARDYVQLLMDNGDQVVRWAAKPYAEPDWEAFETSRKEPVPAVWIDVTLSDQERELPVYFACAADDAGNLKACYYVSRPRDYMKEAGELLRSWRSRARRVFKSISLRKASTWVMLRIPRPGRRLPEIEIMPGRGVEGCELGGDRDSAIQRFGTPDQQSARYLEFPRSGVDVACKFKKVDTLFFFFRADGYAAFNGRTTEGIGADSTVEEVLQQYGEPRKHDSTPTAAGGVNETLYYDRLGLVFDFHHKQLEDIRLDAPRDDA